MPSTSSERTKREPPRLVGQTARVRVGADRRRLESTTTRNRDAPRQHLGALALAHRIGFPREHRLVELEPVDRLQDPVGHDLVAGTQVAEVAEHDLRHVDLPRFPVAHDARTGRVQYCEAVEGSFGAVLLHYPDEDVEEQHEPEQTVPGFAEDEDEHERGAEDRVEPREHVRAQDLRELPARVVVGDVHLPGAYSLRNLVRAEPAGSGGRGGTRDSGVAHRQTLPIRGRPGEPVPRPRAGTVARL